MAVAVSSVAENIARVIVPAFPVPPWGGAAFTTN
jgi:hypothetical protein